MTESYDAEQRRALAAAERRGERPRCPACGGALARTPVEPSAQVGYVRRRVLLVCSSCRRSAAVDRPAG